MQSYKLSTYKEEEENEVATRDDTRGMSILQRGGVISTKPAPTLDQEKKIGVGSVWMHSMH